MDPNADVETTSTSAMPVLLTPVQVGVAGAQTGDAYGRFATEVHGFLVRTVRDDDVAADILADAFTALLVEERGGRWPDHPRAWLYRVASNLAMSRGRRPRVALLPAAQGFDGATIAMTIGRAEAATRTLMCRSRTRLRELIREGDR